uniref:C2H2-type domain-containing protein n=1 Tax=Anopheles atroparvus TaxID=41427 RepID=A0AAG5DMD1_ANOAO
MENAENVELKPCKNVDDPLAIGVVKKEPINGYNESDDRDAPMYNDRSGDDLTMRDCLVKLESMCTDEIEIGEVKMESGESDYTKHEEHYTEISRTSCNVLSDQSLPVQGRTQHESQSEIKSMPIEVATSVVSKSTTKLKWKRSPLQNHQRYVKRVAKQTPQEHAEVLARRRARYKMERDLERSYSMPIEETTSDVSNKTIKLNRKRRRPRDHLRYVQKVAKQSPQEHAEELARRRARYKMKRDLERSSLQSSTNDNMQSSEQRTSVQAEMQRDSESTVVKMPIDKDTNSESSMHAYVECLEIGPALDNTQTSGLIEMTKHSYDCQECGKPFTREAKLKSHSCSRKGKVRKQCSVES